MKESLSRAIKERLPGVRGPRANKTADTTEGERHFFTSGGNQKKKREEKREIGRRS